MSPSRAFVVATAVLVALNVARALGAPGLGSVPGALVIVAAMVLVARAAGLRAEDLGCARADVASGLRWGLAAFGVIALVVVVAALLPFTSGYFDDARADVSGASLVYEVVVSVLLVTVIPEELAFRGVLLGAGRAAWGTTAGVLASSALFGLWHISPTLRTMSGNDELAGASDALVVLANVAATFAAGVFFCWLRLRSRSLLAPVLAHLGTNAAALVAAWAVAR